MVNKNDGVSETRYQVLGYLAVAVIILSIVTFGLKMTGYISYGIVNLTVETSAAINFTSQFIEFESGKVNDGALNGTVISRGSATNCNWTVPTEGFVIENIGNRDVNLSFLTNKTALQFIGGGAMYQFNVTNAEPGSCANYTSMDIWHDVNATTPGTMFCNLSADNNNDTIRVDIKLVIPSDVTPGEKVDQFNAIATSI